MKDEEEKLFNELMASVTDHGCDNYFTNNFSAFEICNNCHKLKYLVFTQVDIQPIDLLTASKGWVCLELGSDEKLVDQWLKMARTTQVNIHLDGRKKFCLGSVFCPVSIFCIKNCI